MGPDPEKIHNGSDFITNQIDDEVDMEVDEQHNEGYFRLNLANANEYAAVDDESSGEDSSEDEGGEETHEFAPFDAAATATSLPNVPQIPSVSSELVASVWNQKTPSEHSAIELTEEKSEQITQIMKGISLPNAPNWLDQLSTESVLERIRMRAEADDCNVKN